MSEPNHRRLPMAALCTVALLLAACGGSDINFGPTPTVTGTPTNTAVATATATRTPNAMAVAGQIVVDGKVRGDQTDGLMPLPPDSKPPAYDGFDRGLGGADWMVDDGTASGTTDADGHFSINGLTPGQHTVRVTKTVDGNLMDLTLIIIVGDDGSADVVAEVTWGLVRTTSTYVQNGAAMRAVFAASGAHVITRGGDVVELGDTIRTVRDADGDGRFDPQGCHDGPLHACDERGGCGPEEACTCIASCPFCDDCFVQACLPVGTGGGPTCSPDGPCKMLPYACAANDACSIPGDTCTCIEKCAGCDSCVGSVCLPSCQPSELTRIDLLGQDRLVLGQTGQASATAYLSDGSVMDVTGLATWASSQPSVATINGWGQIATAGIGATDITAALGDLVSTPLSLTVVERPALRVIHLQNASCYYPYAGADGSVRPLPVPPSMAGAVAPPSCGQVIRVGATLQLVALGEFDGNYYEDITAQVAWRTDPASVGAVTKGVFSAEQAGSTSITAQLDGVDSNAVDVRVVDHATVVDLSIYPADRGYAYPVPIPEGERLPCADCGFYSLTLLRGDSVRFAATARYDTGEWEDVTSSVAWRSSDAAVATIDATGVLTAVAAGDVAIDATLGDITSGLTNIHVVDEATLQSIYVYQEGQDRVVGKGEQVIFHANGYYDIGFDRDVTAAATWHSSDDAIGGFDSPGVFTGRSAGIVSVWAELDGQQSSPAAIEVYATSELDYCDPNAINRATWSDGFNRVTLESDCAEYTAPAVVSLRFSVTETQRPGGIFDPCLDLYAYRDKTLVRTIRQEGCGDPFLTPSAPGRDEEALKYQLTAFWDLKDGDGNTVPPGTYTVVGRFYLYYDPVVQLTVRVD